MGFNPHTHTGCDLMLVCSAVQCRCFNPHTHTGCDIPSLGSSKSNISFNPHTHTGCDCWRLRTSYLRGVSIHTPIQGVTSVTLFAIIPNILFQSTHPYRVWLAAEAAKIAEEKFQSTHPYRVWPFTPLRWIFRSMFQSTHPYRVWHETGQIDFYFEMFQSTHPYRVWLGDPVFVHAAENSFNPHTHTGCDFRFSLWY